ASGDSGGYFGIAHLGADYLINPDLLAGISLQFDTLTDSSASSGTSIDGRGWLAGPYVTARLAPNLIFDGRMSWGRSSNDLVTSLSSGSFDTNRFLIDLNLSGNFDWKDWVISPNFSLSYIEDDQDTFVDSLNVTVPGQKVSLGQIKFGPTFSTTMEGRNHMIIQPSFTVNGIYNFANTSGALITNNTADETDGFRARLEGKVKLTNRHGTEYTFGANYDGIGQSDFESWGINAGVRIPLQ
ncbi:MAG: autotransporter outer membrane beta-barrel domain-containing protein, partial [Roseobacter sp.]